MIWALEAPYHRVDCVAMWSVFAAKITGDAAAVARAASVPGAAVVLVLPELAELVAAEAASRLPVLAGLAVAGPAVDVALVAAGLRADMRLVRALRGAQTAMVVLAPVLMGRTARMEILQVGVARWAQMVKSGCRWVEARLFVPNDAPVCGYRNEFDRGPAVSLTAAFWLDWDPGKSLMELDHRRSAAHRNQELHRLWWQLLPRRSPVASPEMAAGHQPMPVDRYPGREDSNR
jgi:hypothetical protein